MDEKEEKSRKRNLEDFLTRDQNPESEEQNEPQQSKKKKQKKNKKSKEQRETSDPDVPLNIVSNDDNETVKKKKDKKVELVVEVELFSNCVIKCRSER